VLSFYATKLITTGEGGMLVADDERILARVRDLREYDERPDDRPRFNYKMTDLQAALGLVQAARLPEFLARRRALASRYRARLAAGTLRQPAEPPDGRHAWHRYVVTGPRPAAHYLAALEARGVTARRPVFRPLHRDLGLDGFPGAEEAWAHAVSLPLYPALGDGDAARVVAAAEAAASA
jgi:dTDP-4-amino-4,6-dideoxygalactose transaminase